MAQRIDGKVAIVTGAGNGIGEAYAHALAAEGAAVLVADLDREAGARVASVIAAEGGRASHVVVDVADERGIGDMAAECAATFGGIDILVNNAGLQHGKWNSCTELPADDWRRIFDVNVLAPIIAATACRQSMAARGGGVIVNTSSMAAYTAGGGAYSVSKHALNGVTMALASDLARDGIRVVGIAPGMTDTPINRTRRPPEIVQQVLARQLIPRMGQVDDLCNMLLFLCSDESSFITGQTFLVDGGANPRP
jgi:NAD(P)-dependent dehydrogenase (short-subunit alcohol dehydrogenase family)